MVFATDHLQGDVAIVTGAASGLGRSIASKLAAHGATVACADIDPGRNQETADQITRAGGKAFPVEVDTGRPASVRAMVEEVYGEAGSIDILVNNAAIVRFSQIEECSDEEWQQVLTVNLSGYFFCLRAVYPYMKESGGGRIVQLSSSSAKSGSSFGGPHYTAAKGGIISLTKYAARRWAKDNIRVNAVCPGITDTPMARDPSAPEGALEQMIKAIPLGRLAEPDDIAGGVLFLVSEEARYITGITLDINGGRYVYGN